MNNIQRITKNVFSLSIAQIVSIFLGLLYTMLMARYLGAEGFGILNFALAYTGVLSIFSEMGFSQVIVREVARDKSLAEKYISNAILLKLILSVPTMFLIIEGVNLFDNSYNNEKIVIIIGVSMIIGTFNSIFYSIYQAFEKIEFQSFGQILNNSLLYIGTLVIINYNYKTTAFASLFLLTSIINLIYNLSIVSLKFVRPTLKYEYLFWKKLLKEAIPFAITGLSISVYFWTDTLTLSFFKGNEVVGLYNAAYRIISALLFIPYIFNSTIFPLMAQYHISSRECLILSFKNLYKVMALIGIPLGIGTILIADDLILLIYGSKYSESIIVLRILICSFILILMRNPFERLLEAINQQAKVTKIFIMGAVANVILNVAFIPKYSYVGAGIATLIANLIVLILLIEVTKNYGIFISKKEITIMAKILVSSIVMGIFLKLLPISSILIKIPSAIVVYYIFLGIVKAFSEEEKMIIKSIFSKKSNLSHISKNQTEKKESF